MTFLNDRFLEPRLGKWDPSERPPDAPVDHVPDGRGARSSRPRACGTAGLYLLVAVVILSLLTFLPSAPLRNPETGEIFGN